MIVKSSNNSQSIRIRLAYMILIVDDIEIGERRVDPLTAPRPSAEPGKLASYIMPTRAGFCWRPAKDLILIDFLFITPI